MGGIPLTRCQFLIPFAVIHDEIGANTEALLEKFRLPVSLEEKAHHFLPILRAIHFAEAAQRNEGITDIGFQASRRLEFGHLSEKLRTLIGCSPTLLSALRQACRWSKLEDTILTMWLEQHHDHVRICSKLDGTDGMDHLEHSQWLQNLFTVHIVRQFAGPDWAPATIAFEARYLPGVEARASWPNTRFLAGQKASWIDVPISHLSLPSRAYGVPPDPPDDEAEPGGTGIIGTLKLMLPSYLDHGPPSVAEIAEMAGMSVRSLQRRLWSAGLTYSDLVETARFENAAKLLRDTDGKIIEIAFSSGYTDPAHFSRAFRRISGITPRQFRAQWRPR